MSFAEIATWVVLGAGAVLIAGLTCFAVHERRLRKLRKQGKPTITRVQSVRGRTYERPEFHVDPDEYGVD